MTKSELSPLFTISMIAGVAGVIAASLALTHPTPASATPTIEFGATARVSNVTQTQVLMSVRSPGFERRGGFGNFFLATFTAEAGINDSPSGVLPDYVKVDFTPVLLGDHRRGTLEGFRLLPTSITRNVALNQGANVTVDLLGVDVNFPIAGEIDETGNVKGPLHLFVDTAVKLLGYHGMVEASSDRTFHGLHIGDVQAALRLMYSRGDISITARLGASGGLSVGADSLTGANVAGSGSAFTEVQLDIANRWFMLARAQLTRFRDQTETTGNVGVGVRF